MAVNLNNSNTNKNIFCVLCGHDGQPNSHYLSKCPIYENPRKKFDKLRSMNACTKCSFKNHKTKDCKFNFKSNCKNCAGAHMTHLCLKPDNKTSNSNVLVNAENSEASSLVSNISLVQVLNSVNGDPVALPTFTAYISDENIPVKIFKDGGAQASFICQTLAASLDLKIVKSNIELKIEGFNSGKTIKTDVVSVPVKIGENLFEVEAICIEKNRTKFNANGNCRANITTL